jgi:hypothetical protein
MKLPSDKNNEWLKFLKLTYSIAGLQKTYMKIWGDPYMKLNALFVFISIFSIHSLSFARPTLNETTMKVASLEARPATTEELYGMAALNGCSGGLANIGRSKEQKAVVITNGHCVSGSLGANEAWVNQPSQRTFSLYSKTGAKITVRASKLLYATLTDTDMGLYELTETYEQLEAKGVKAFPLTSNPVLVGTAARVTSSYWQETLNCSVDRIVFRLLEGFGSDVSNPSVATKSFAMSANCITRGGYSGTPVINDQQEIIGLLFTGHEGGGTRCEERSPCEEDESGNRTSHPRTSYVARIDQVAGCLENGELNLALGSCTLFR